MRSLSTRAAGLTILVLGIWGGVVPFIGPYFHYSLGPAHAWTWTTGRLWLDILPGAAAVIGGLMLINAGWRPHARVGALLALAAGIWFVVGPDLSHLWNAAGAQGVPHGGPRLRMWESLGYHTGLGVVIAALAAYVLPRFPAVARAAAADDAAVADRRAAPAADRHRGREAGAVAGGAMAAGAAEERMAARREPVADEGMAGRREPVREERTIVHREPVADEGMAGRREPMAEERTVAPREPAADEGMAGRREPVDQGMATGGDRMVADEGMASGAQRAGDDPALTRGQPAADGLGNADDETGTGAPEGSAWDSTSPTEAAYGEGYDAHPRPLSGRRRRGGLLSNLTRR